ncbi:MAG: Bifunctional aspartokinase/homoserine dehydrogenase 1 [Spirochaetes bacterium ADurb.Bin110]|nr:MAG: Bifunctional aspartokinase/homoserine dehydrogenase 1 [Spirochaetes bacterium ADurb.Bin110]
MKILKFGGTSTGSIEALKSLASIVQKSCEKILVVSALSGITDVLIASAKLASEGGDWQSKFVSIRERHYSMISALLKSQYRESATGEIKALLDELSSLLLGISLVQDLSPRTLDLVASYGERLSAALIARILSQAGLNAEVVDARKLIVTDDKFGAAHWLESETIPRVKSFFADFTHIAVVTGFITSTIEGVTTTLGRGGSDLTASILAACLGAEEIQIWTDVDGIMTADPRAVPDAFVVPELSYLEAMEMSHFGAKVLHPPAILPAMDRDIPVRILNTFSPDKPGTRIVKQGVSSNWPIRGIAAIPSISLLLLQGPGLPGVAGIAARMFAALASAGINIILITQGSSELSICCAVLPQDAEKGVLALEEEFKYEIGTGTIQSPSIEQGLSIIAVVGEMMKHRVGISGRVFKALGRNGINVVAIAQGSSELNISIVIGAKDRNKAMCSIHDAFFLAGVRTVNVFLVGTGLIGGTLLAQVAAQHERLFRDRSIRVQIAGIANSRHMLIDSRGIDLENWRDALESGKKTDISAFIQEILSLNLQNACFCDCTASEDITKHYEILLSSSVSVVTPNKRANSGSLHNYHRLMNIARELDVPYRYETTVGAGLPVIGTIQDLVASGDEILRIEAVLSGTISFIFNNLREGNSFSDLVTEAKLRGYTEPDPRDDLSAKDIVRKMIILAREAGFPLEESLIQVESLVTKRITDATSIEEFLTLLPEMDEMMRKCYDSASRSGGALRYVAIVTPMEARLSLSSFGPDSPFYSLSGTDNMVVITSKRYSQNPLVIRGPGAGAEVTAGGVFADILKTAESYL